MAADLINLVHPNVKGDYNLGIPLATWIDTFVEKTIHYTHVSCNVTGQYFTKSEVQLMISELVSFVFYVRDDVHLMLAKETFDIDNLIVDTNHKPMFKKVLVKPILHEVEIEDFTQLFYLIQNIFGNDYSHLPIDMVAFLKLLIDDPLSNRQLICCHYALMHDLDRNTFIERCYQIYDASCRKSDTTTAELFVDAFNELDRPTPGDWKYLVQFIASDCKSPVRLVYRFGENMFNRGAGDILRFIRHCVVHLTEKRNLLTLSITQHDIHKIITLYLPHIVLEMQEKLFNLNLITFEDCARFCPRRM